jgi:hypothetical protein
MPLWSMDEWQYLEREVVTDPKGRQWTVALMDVLGQEGDPDMPNKLLELQYSSGRYFTLIYSGSGQLQRERGYATLAEATDAYGDLLVAVIDGSLNPSQPTFQSASAAGEPRLQGLKLRPTGSRICEMTCRDTKSADCNC